MAPLLEIVSVLGSGAAKRREFLGIEYVFTGWLDDTDDNVYG